MTNFRINDENVRIYNTWDAENWYVASLCGVTNSMCRDFENFHLSAILGGSKSDFWSKMDKIEFMTHEKWLKNENFQNPRIYFL